MAQAATPSKRGRVRGTFDSGLSAAKRNLQPQTSKLVGLSFAAEDGASTAEAVERFHISKTK